MKPVRIKGMLVLDAFKEVSKEFGEVIILITPKGKIRLKKQKTVKRT